MLRVLVQTFILALTQIWTNKVRAALAMLMIVIGVAALIVIIGSSEGFKQNILKEFSSFGANKVWIFPRRPNEARDRYSWRQIRMTVKEADGLPANCPSLMRMTPMLDFTTDVQFGELRKPFVQVRGIRPVWHDIEDRSVTIGRPFSAIDSEVVRNVCLVNDKAIEELGLPNRGPGNYILVGGRRFLVVGVVETKAVSPIFGQNDAQSEVFVPLKTAQSMRPENGVYVIAQTFNAEMFEDAKAEATFYLRKSRGLKGNDPDTFGVQAIEQVIAQVGRIGTLITFFLAGLVGVALLVGGVGIMVIQLVAVTERTREIGLRKAVGAKPAVILLQFLVEAVVLCMVGAGIGLLVGHGLVLGVRYSVPALAGAVVPLWATMVAVVFCGTVGVVFGMFPAIKAARLDPIVALRHD